MVSWSARTVPNNGRTFIARPIIVNAVCTGLLVYLTNRNTEPKCFFSLKLITSIHIYNMVARKCTRCPVTFVGPKKTCEKCLNRAKVYSAKYRKQKKISGPAIKRTKSDNDTAKHLREYRRSYYINKRDRREATNTCFKCGGPKLDAPGLNCAGCVIKVSEYNRAYKIRKRQERIANNNLIYPFNRIGHNLLSAHRTRCRARPIDPARVADS